MGEGEEEEEEEEDEEVMIAPSEQIIREVVSRSCRVERVERSSECQEEEELDDLEQSLQALEKLDRSSPDLWPDQIPGVHQFLPNTPGPGQGEEVQGEYLQNLSREDLETLMQLGSLGVPQLMQEVKRLQNIAYQLGQEETKEMTRGKYLNILRKRNNSGRR